MLVVQIQAKIVDIRFSSDDGYQIAIAMLDNTIDKISVKGHMSLIKDTTYELEGIYREDPVRMEEYFQVKGYKIANITDTDSLMTYLTSSIFEGVGRRTARKIIEIGGEDTLKLLANNPNFFIENGIPKKSVQTINMILNNKDFYQELKDMTSDIELNEHVFNEIYKYFKANEIDITELKTNPFKYIKEINGFGFKKADALYLKYNHDKIYKGRLVAGIEAIIENECLKTGDTLVDMSLVMSRSIAYMNLSYDFNMNMWLNLAVENKDFYMYGDKIQTREYHKIEFEITNNLRRRLEVVNVAHQEKMIQVKITKLEEETKINYSEVQKKAIIKGLNNKLSIITGGPGTGKTTIVNAIVNIYEQMNYDPRDVKDISEKIILCAPTGRAAQRMYETTNFSAKTIHSLLIWDPHSNKFAHNFENPLQQDLIVIDEFSMVDMFLAHALFRAIKPTAKIIIVGDKDQLESVLPGNVLNDLLNISAIPSIKLDQIFRLKTGNSIASLANIIHRDEKIEFVKTDDIGYINTTDNLVAKIKQVVDKTKAAGYDENDIQILYPKYKGAAGIDKINEFLKPVSDNKGIVIGEILYQIGDKIMQLKNDYNNDIYNGDIGYITKVYNVNATGQELAIQVEFRGITVELKRNELDNITHAYAISIHKSQGSEFAVIILPITRDSINMITKKLIYTAVTRSKDKLIIIGDIECLNDGLKKNDRIRNTNLDKLLIN